MGHSKNNRNKQEYIVSKLADPKTATAWDLHRKANGEIFDNVNKLPPPDVWIHDKEQAGSNMSKRLIAITF